MRPINIPTWALLLLSLGLLFPGAPETGVQKAELVTAIYSAVMMVVVSLVLSELLRPKPKIEDARPAGIGEFDFPTAIEGRPIPLIWGRVKLQSPNVVWYGDLRQYPIRESIRTGLWSKKRFTKGYQYHVGIQMGLCRGQVDALRRIWVGDKVIWTGNVQDGAIDLEDLAFFGGNDYGNGGLQGTLRVHSGSKTQAVNSYLTGYQSPTPGYRGTCHVVWEGGYIGNSTTIQPWRFELERYPNGLALTGGKEIVNSADANPMCVLYELLTDDEWGFGFPTGDVDVTALTAAADTLYNEGNGFSMVLDKVVDAGTFLREIERQIDGVVFLDQHSGQWSINLARSDYDVDLIPQVVREDGDVLETKDWNPGTWESLVNEVQLEFTDRTRDYFTTFAKGSNAANQRVQGRPEPVTIKMPGVKDADLAAQLADREIRTTSRPLAKVELELTREFWQLNPGDVFAWTDDVVGVEKLPMRVTRVDLGSLEHGRIAVQAVQDIYSYASAFNGAPQSVGWSEPTQDVEEIPAARHLIHEAPYAIVRRDPDAPETLDRIWAGGRREDEPAVAMNLYERNAAGTPSGAYDLTGEVYEFLLIGKVRTAIGEEGANPGTIEIEADDDVHDDLLAAFESASAGDVGGNLANLILVGDEYMAPTGVTDQTTYLQLTSTYRGMLDTAPADHAVNDKVYLVFVGGNLSDSTLPQGNNVDAQLRQVSRTDETTEVEAVTKQFTMDDRVRRPYPPVEMNINGSRYPAAPSWDTMRSGGSTLDDRGFEVTFTRRNWRTYDEVEGITTDAATLDSAFPTLDSTEYRAESIDDPDGAPSSMDTTAWNGGPALLFVSRTKLLRAKAGVKPTTMRIDVETRHILSATTYAAAQALGYTFGPGTSTLDNDNNWGNVAFGAISPTWSAPATGTYTFNIGTAMPSGAVQARINGGSWVTVIAAGAVTGTLPGVTAADTIEVQHLSNTGTATETFLEALAPAGTVNAYAVMVY